MTGAIFRNLAQQDLVVPYLENAFHQDNWPDVYNVLVDSTPYYGLSDADGVSHETGSGDGYFHPSTHPLMTERELFYRFHPEHAKKVEQEKRTLAGHMSLAVGTAMHAVTQTQLNMTGLLTRGDEDWHDHPLVPDVRARYPANNLGEWEYLRETTKTRGRMDGVLNHPLAGIIGFEYKTMNARKFGFTDTPLDEWIVQTNLGMDHYGIDECVLLLQEIGLPWRMKEFRIHRRASVLEPVYEKFSRVLEAVKRDVPPRCEHPLGSDLVRRCPVGDLCWN